MEAIKRKLKPQPAEIINEGIIGGLSAGVLNSILRLFTDHIPPFKLTFAEGTSGFIGFFAHIFQTVFTYVLNLIPAVLVGLALAAVYIAITRSLDSPLSKRVAWVVAVAALGIMLFTPLTPYAFDGSAVVRLIMLAIAAALPTFTFTSNT